MLHMDKVTSYRSLESITDLKTFRVRPIDQPPYSPDLAPSGFYVLEKPKAAMAGQEFKSIEALPLAPRGS
jgi:hypothetical protein